MAHDGTQSQQIAVGTEPCDLAKTDRGDDRVVTEGLPGVDVGQMNLDRGQADGCHRVSQGDAVVGEGTGVEDDA